MPSIFYRALIGDSQKQSCLINLIGQFVYDNSAASALAFFKVSSRAHNYSAAAGAISVARAFQSVDESGGGKIRRRHFFHQHIGSRFRMRKQKQAGVGGFADIVRWNVGGQFRPQFPDAPLTRRFGIREGRTTVHFRAVVIGNESTVSLSISSSSEWAMRDIALRCSASPPDCRRPPSRNCPVRQSAGSAAKNPAPSHEGIIDRLAAVRMKFTQHFADDARGFFMRLVKGVARFQHRKQNAPMHRLSPSRASGRPARR